MKLLLNMNLPRSLTHRLNNLGYECRHVGDIGMSQADDTEIVEAARKSGEVILTHDLDYGLLLTFSGASKPSVIILRIRNVGIDRMLDIVTNALPRVTDDLSSGAVVILDEHSVRVRHLPA